MANISHAMATCAACNYQFPFYGATFTPNSGIMHFCPRCNNVRVMDVSARHNGNGVIGAPFVQTALTDRANRGDLILNVNVATPATPANGGWIGRVSLANVGTLRVLVGRHEISQQLPCSDFNITRLTCEGSVLPLERSWWMCPTTHQIFTIRNRVWWHWPSSRVTWMPPFPRLVPIYGGKRF